MQPINWFDLTPPPLLVLPITLLSTFLRKIQVHYLLQRHPPLQSRRCNRPRLLPKRLKIIDVPVHLRFHFSVWTKHKGTLKPKLEILIHMQDQYLCPTSNVIFHQHSQTTLKYCSNVIYESGYKLRSLRWDIWASLIRYRINKSSKSLWKINKFTFTKTYW